MFLEDNKHIQYTQCTGDIEGSLSMLSLKAAEVLSMVSSKYAIEGRKT